MKKILFIILSFVYFIPLVANAKDISGSVNFENAYRGTSCSNCINLFEETYNKTNFINLLYAQGIRIGDYLNSTLAINDSNFFNSSRKYNISIFTPGDFNHVKDFYYNSQKMTNDNNANGIIGTLIAEHSDLPSWLDLVSDYNKDIGYIMVFHDGTYRYRGTMGYTDRVYNTFSYDSSNDYFSINFTPEYVIFFDKKGSPLGYVKGSSDYLYNLRFNLLPSSDVPDMTSWYAYTYYTGSDSKVSFSDSIDKVFPDRFFFDGGVVHYTSNNAGYGSVYNFFNNLFNGNFEIDFSRWNMSFVYDNVFYRSGKKFISFIEQWYSIDSLTIPDNYKLYDISKFKMGYYLVPNTSVCTKASDFLFYFSSNTDYERQKMYFTYYKKNEKDGNVSLDFYKSFYVFSSKAWQVYSYNPFVDLGVSVSEFGNMAFNVTQSNEVSTYNLYLNSSCYNVYSVSGDKDLSFDVGGNNFTLTPNDLNYNYSNYNSTQANPNTNNPSSSSSGSNNPNVSGFEGSGFNFGNIVGNVGNYASSFFGSISALVGITSTFFAGLPSEIVSILLAAFSIGLIVIIIKLFL